MPLWLPKVYSRKELILENASGSLSSQMSLPCRDPQIRPQEHRCAAGHQAAWCLVSVEDLRAEDLLVICCMSVCVVWASPLSSDMILEYIGDAKRSWDQYTKNTRMHGKFLLALYLCLAACQKNPSLCAEVHSGFAWC